MNPRAILGLALASTSLVLLPAACILVVDGDGGSLHHAFHAHDSRENAIQGSGVAKTEARPVADFHRIVVESSANLSIEVGGATSLSVTGDDNLVGFVTTEVRDGSLVVGMKSGSYSNRLDLRVSITTPALDGLSIRGSSDVAAFGLKGESFAVEILGSGDVRATGKVEHLDAAIAGSGDLHLDGLEAREAKVSVSGSGDVDVWASETLVASVSGSGDVTYRGEPKVTKSVAGSGSVAKR